MVGRHRRPPAWRRLLLRLRRSDRAARTAALQAEGVALRAMPTALRVELTALRAELTALRAELATVQAAHAAAAGAAAAAATPGRELRWVSLDLPSVRAAIAVVPEATALDITSAAAVDVSASAFASATTLQIDLRDVIARADPVLAAVPEAALLAPTHSRDTDVVDLAVPVGSDAPAEAARRSA